ncbi:MAG: hypothetical protein ACE5NP_01890 [Anaerolineae bacterium]
MQRFVPVQVTGQARSQPSRAQRTPNVQVAPGWEPEFAKPPDGDLPPSFKRENQDIGTRPGG